MSRAHDPSAYDPFNPFNPPPPPPTTVIIHRHLCATALAITGAILWSPAVSLSLGFATVAILAFVDAYEHRRRRLALYLDQSSPPRGAAFDRIEARHAIEVATAAPEDLLGGAFKTNHVGLYKQVKNVGQGLKHSVQSTLLLGPAGSGKTALARAIHHYVARISGRTGPFVPVNCATIHEQMGMNELLGHASNAFTGAQGPRAGLLQQADGGTLFLDEVGDLPLEAQGMLLVAFEEKRYRPMGSDTLVSSDFRIIAATNRDIPELIRQKLFRRDLYDRIKSWQIHIPSVAQRPEDAPDILASLLQLIGQEQKRTVTMTREAERVWLAFNRSPAALWPDNFRGLYDAIDHMASATDSGQIGVDLVQQELDAVQTRWHGDGASDGLDGLVQAAILVTVVYIERYMLAEVVRICRRSESQGAAARMIYSVDLATSTNSESSRLRKYLEKYALTFELIRGG